LSAADAAWLHMDRPTNLMVINSLMLFDERVDFERLQRVVRRRLVDRYPRFRQRISERALALRPPSWEDDGDFALEHHVHHIALADPGDQQALHKLVGDLMATPLNRARPLWDLYLVDNVGEGCAVFVRMHHCIADGIALARVLLSLTDRTRTAGIAPPARERATVDPVQANGHLAGGPGGLGGPLGDVIRGAYAATATLAGQAAQLAWHPLRVGRLASDVARDAGTAMQLALTPADATTALKGAPGVSRQVAWSEPLALSLVKQVAHDQGVTVNDVLLGAIAGALRRHLQRRHETVGTIQALVPFNLRPLDELVPRELGNRFGLVYVALPVDTPGAQERLRAVHRRMKEIKRSRNAPVSYEILGALGFTPIALERRVIDFLTAKSTVVITNVPGPQETIYLAGARVRTAMVWAPTSGSVGMSVSILSYRGEITVGLMVDPARVSRPQGIVADLEREVLALAKLPAQRSRTATTLEARAASK
jgi:diacylglycerol O-acyltransferase / wax synthase